MRLILVALFVALVAVPFAQVMADTRSHKLHLYIWNGYFSHPHEIAVAKSPRSKGLHHLIGRPKSLFSTMRVVKSRKGA